jgi:exodeoxyribonuclease VII small subunit
MPGARKKEDLTFEKAMGRLEAIVETMEGEEVPIEEALKQFEEGMELVDFCEKKLNEVQKKVELILERREAAPAEVHEAGEEYGKDGE